MPPIGDFMRLFALPALFLVFAASAHGGDRFSEPRACDAPTLVAPVCLAQRSWNAADASAALGTRDVVGIAEGDVLSVLARRSSGPVTLCCSIDAPLSRIGDSDLWVLSVRVLGLDRAVLDLQVTPPSGDLAAYYGAQVQASRPAAKLLGTLVRQTLHSAALGEERHLTIYLPPGHDPAQRYPVVYLADGGVLPAYAGAIEAAIVSGRVRPVIVAGLSPGMRDPGNRAREYLVGRSASRFRDQMQFVFDEAMPFIETTYGGSDRPQDRMLAGFSDGAAWALATGLRNRTRIGTITALSLGWIQASDGVASDDRPRLYLAAGTLEPDFYRMTAQAARRAEGSAAPLRFDTFASGHVLVAWQTMLVEALAWSFPRHP